MRDTSSTQKWQVTSETNKKSNPDTDATLACQAKPKQRSRSCNSCIRGAMIKNLRGSGQPQAKPRDSVEAHWLALSITEGLSESKPRLRAKNTLKVGKMESKIGSCKYSH